jgi:signal transduction histidine kinase
MNLQFNAFAITLLMPGVAVLLLAQLLSHRAPESVRWFCRMMVLVSVWAIAYALELASDNLAAMLFWIRVEYCGIAFIPAVWIVFVIRFVGRDDWLTLRNQALIYVVPVLTLTAVWTNPWHHLHYRSVGVDATSGPFPLLAITPGPWYQVHTVFFYFVLAWGAYLLAVRFRRADPVYQRQNWAILVGAFIPWLSNLIYLLGFKPYRHLDLTPYAFLLTAVVVGFALFRYRLFDVVPLAHGKVIEGLREGVLVLDARGRVVDVNEPMRGFLGVVGAQCVGRRLEELLPTEQGLQAEVEREQGGRIEVSRGASAEVRHYDVRVTPLRERSGLRCGTLLVFWDITETRRATDRLQAQAAELQELNQLKTRMLSIIAHDLRSPLATLSGILEVSEEGMLSEEEFRGMIPLVSRSLTDTTALLDNLLNWSKSQLEGEVLRPERFDVKTLVKENLQLFAKRASEKGLQISDRVPDGSWVWADPNMISLVIRNLVSNATKFCRAGDLITVELETEPGLVHVVVGDTGAGMSPELMGKLFGWEVVSRPGTQQEPGTGLGLRLCKDFVEKNGGRISAESTLGRGSRFRFSLPTEPPRPLPT